ncbi:S53 family peptidase [Amnibacterium kyonggiense]|uniref:Subtilase family protein n=1 Tax=Amnibacterium kyonggiense TaxID=595671 RepID=A0A4R7FSY8_9MICO|nr:S53 family peptidase [Amnibacterium kyonggiense]TDS80991.1 subtilase family protein [Amnibacterium kyonggiense]
MPRTSLRARALPVLLVAAVAAGSVLTAAPAQAEGRRVVVPAARPAWATAAADTGAVSGATTVEFELALSLPDEAGARAFALAASTPGTPQYRRYLSPSDWIARFAPTQATVDTVTAAVADAGLTVEAVPQSRLFLLLKGTATQVDAFLSTRLHAFDIDGEQRLAAVGAATLPQQVARSVAAITFTHARITHTPSKKKPAVSACSRYWRQHVVQLPRKAYGQRSTSTPLCGYSAAQLRTIARAKGSALTGAGQTIAVIDAFGAPSMRRDLATYSAKNGLPAADYAEVLPASYDESYGCTAADWQPEQALDLEAAHAVAPRAKLVYVGASDCGTGFDVAMSTVLDRGLASIVSNSWGATALDTLAGAGLGDDATKQSMVVMLHQQLQAAGQGVGLYFASGDYGDERELLGTTAVDFPASSPFVTAVGGTATGLNRSGSRAFTTAWGENVALLSGSKRATWSPKLPGYFLAGAGGGRSSLFAAPGYQAGVVPGSLAHGMRTATDVSALAASSTGFLVGFRPGGPSGAYRTTSVGGTSLATPIVAAQVALAQQATGRRLGFVNPALYAIARTTPSAFRDVAPSSVRRTLAVRNGKRTYLVTVDRDGTLATRKGYDLPTGLGELTSSTTSALGRL